MSLDPNWILAICAVLGLVGGIVVGFWRISVKLHAVATPIHAVREQVQNTHQTNLREDMDGIAENVSKVLTMLAVTNANVENLDKRMVRLEDRLDRA